MDVSSNQLIRVYKMGIMGFLDPAQKKFEKDAAKLAKEGWRVQSAVPSNDWSGYPRRITVVYAR